MKPNSFVFIFFLLLLLLLSSASARLLLPPRLVEKASYEITKLPITSFSGKKEDVSSLMGLEEDECDERDEECLKRRMVAEAHLDYIYTQHHKKP
ncbi:putative phytosulfokines 6 [Manihot esculenta]|uniref:Phytosulfokine n=1 Tax=Manihot esculenta TaxID=3983 RepID=A0A2C9VE09_MANES|nr:putative phytosulfokines 6 [Manihot esculenta]OAY42851.1 hypothetical protein MANES_08G021100v8 [Manihot esculenta]